jgi:endonuclease
LAIYEKTTKELMTDFVKASLKDGQVFDKKLVVAWFAANYPKIKRATVEMHVEGMSVNSRLRKHHAHIRPGSGHDLFFKLAPGQYRLWKKGDDPAPLYPNDFNDEEVAHIPSAVDAEDDHDVEEPTDVSSDKFAFERDLRNYLEKNLQAIEPGLRLYEDDGFNGIEYPVGGRFIDILAVSKSGELVVIELKVSRGYDRVVGQILRYMGWISKNLADGRKVRGIIVAREVSEDLRLAASGLPNISLVEYRLSFSLNVI